LETRHLHNAIKTMPIKSDRNDARSIAQLLRLGWFRPVHCKSMEAQERRAILTARKLLQSKLQDIEFSVRGILRGFGPQGRQDHADALCRTGQGTGRRASTPRGDR
jgi:transposase